MLRVIVDVNVWISALLKPGNAETILQLFREGKFDIYYPQELVRDLRAVAARRKLVGKLRAQDLEFLVELIKSRGGLTKPKAIQAISRDADDDIYLACCKVADCDYLVTGDKDLLVLRRHARTTIVTPAQFLKVLDSE